MLPGRDPASAAMAGLSISPEGLEAGTGTGSMAGTMAGAEGWAAVDGLPPPGAAASVSSGVARVTMLVRCENVGHGEAVFLAPSARGEDEDEDGGAGRGAADGGTDRPRMIPLYTTAAGFPWFATRTPLHLPLSGSTLGSGAGGARQGSQQILARQWQGGSREANSRQIWGEEAVLRIQKEGRAAVCSALLRTVCSADCHWPAGCVAVL